MTIEGEEALSGTPESLAPLALFIGRWRTSGTVLDDAGNVPAEVGWFRIRAGEGRMTSSWDRLIDARWQRWMDLQFERW